MRFVSPIKIETTLLLPLKLNAQISLRMLEVKEIERIFGIKNIEYDTEGGIKGCEPALDSLFYMSPFNSFDRLKIMSAKHCFELEAKTTEAASTIFQKLNLCLRIIQDQSVGMILIKQYNDMGISPNEAYLYPIPENSEPLKLTDNSFREIQKISRSVLKRHALDQKFNIIEEYLNFAMSNVWHKPSKILALFTILEVLYLEDKQNELTFRVTVYVAKLLKLGFDGHRRLKELYKKRGALVHAGKCNFSEEDIRYLSSVVRRSIKSFLTSPQKFNDLDKTLF